MKLLNIVLLSLVCLIYTTALGQITPSCAHCGMTINNAKFKATATHKNDKTLNFDAIECLINFQKSSNEIKNLKVTDYNSGNLIDANSAFYVKSKDRPSPMGAFLTAYASKDDALNVPSGSVMQWDALLEKFKNSDFGVVEHSHHNHHRSDAHGPVGIMGDHLHPKGGFMVSLRAMHMTMDGNRKGADKIKDQEIYQNYMVAPQNMTMQMYMLGVMYAPSDKLTLMAMQNFVSNQMDLTAEMMMPNGMTMQRNFKTGSTGFGDLKLGALYNLWSSLSTSAHLNSSINIPIGSIKGT